MFLVTSQAKPRGRYSFWFNVAMGAAWISLFLLSAWLGKPLGIAIAGLYAVARFVPLVWKSLPANPENQRRSSFWTPLALTAISIFAFVLSAHRGQSGSMVMSALFAVAMVFIAIKIIAETPAS